MVAPTAAPTVGPAVTASTALVAIGLGRLSEIAAAASSSCGGAGEGGDLRVGLRHGCGHARPNMKPHRQQLDVFGRPGFHIRRLQWCLSQILRLCTLVFRRTAHSHCVISLSNSTVSQERRSTLDAPDKPIAPLYTQSVARMQLSQARFRAVAGARASRRPVVVVKAGISADASARVKGSLRDVYAYVADYANYADWHPGKCSGPLVLLAVLPRGIDLPL